MLVMASSGFAGGLAPTPVDPEDIPVRRDCARDQSRCARRDADVTRRRILDERRSSEADARSQAPESARGHLPRFTGRCGHALPSAHVPPCARKTADPTPRSADSGAHEIPRRSGTHPPDPPPTTTPSRRSNRFSNAVRWPLCGVSTCVQPPQPRPPAPPPRHSLRDRCMTGSGKTGLVFVMFRRRCGTASPPSGGSQGRSH